MASTLVLIGAGLSMGLLPGDVGADTDDSFRFLQIRNFLEGQSWGDVRQHRLGLDGTALHWSRLADFPYLLVAWPLSFFVSPDTAVRVSGSTVPFILWGLYVWALLEAVGAVLRSLGTGATPKALTVGAAVTVSSLAALGFASRFGMGSFDHHHLQALALCAALAATLRPRPTWREGALAGAAVAGSAAIGVETLPVLGGLCLVWTLAWLASPGSARREATVAFGAALALTCMVCAAVFAADFAMASQLCDGFGIGVAGLFCVGGGGLALVAATASGSTRLWRWLGLAGVGLAVTVFAVTTGQACLANPMEALSPEIRRDWLGRVLEARPLTSPSVDWSLRGFLMGVLVSALALVVWGWAHVTRDRRPAAILLGGWLLLAIAMAFYQMRFAALGVVPAGVVLGAAMACALEWDTRPPRRMAAILAAALASLSVAHGAMAESVHDALTGSDDASGAFATGSKPAAPNTAVCLSEDALSRLDALPKGRVLVYLNHAGELLRHTHHTALASNYHRGWRDIAVQFELERTTPASAADAMEARGVRYVLLCETEKGHPEVTLTEAEDSLLTKLSRTPVPGLIEHDLGLPDGLRMFEVVGGDPVR